MTLPFHKIHDITYGYGTLMIPLGKRWLAWFKGRGWKLTSVHTSNGQKKPGFHNCTRTGVH